MSFEKKASDSRTEQGSYFLESVLGKTDATRLLELMETAVAEAGHALLHTFNRDLRPKNLSAILAEIRLREELAQGVLKKYLLSAYPEARWAEDEFESGALPAGWWWVTDPVEGNINLIQGMPEWCTSATLVLDGTALITAVYVPLQRLSYKATLGGGAFENGKRLSASMKTELDCCLFGTGQAEPNETEETHRRMVGSIETLLRGGLVLHVSVPSTLQLVDVAAGRRDVFWQASQVRSGLLCGGLLVSEAGGHVSTMSGEPWNLSSPGFLACAPGVHQAVVELLNDAS